MVGYEVVSFEELAVNDEVKGEVKAFEVKGRPKC